MTPQETATKLLEYFGPEGGRWRHGPGLHGGQCCIYTACMVALPMGSRYAAMVAIECAAGIPRGELTAWNDRSDWPTVKAALELVAAGGAT